MKKTASLCFRAVKVGLKWRQVLYFKAERISRERWH
jgi:hypothetical protein